jgi:hypothetical protein
MSKPILGLVRSPPNGRATGHLTLKFSIAPEEDPQKFTPFPSPDHNKLRGEIAAVRSEVRLRSERQGGEVHVAAREDDAQLRRGAIRGGGQMEFREGSRAKEWSDGYRTARLDDDFHAFPNELHGGDDLCLADEQDAIKMAPQNRKCPRRERGAKPVRDSVARIERLQSTCGQRAVGVVGARRLTANDADVSTHGFCSQAGAAEQSAAAHRRKYGVDVWDFFEQLLRRRSLAGDDAVVVVGMDENGPGCGTSQPEHFSA